jgi:hypothetical protein
MITATGQFNIAAAALRTLFMASSTLRGELPERVLNGGFDSAEHWDLAGCVIEDGKLFMNGGSPNPDASQFYAFQVGRTYPVAFTISEFEASTVVAAEGAFRIGMGSNPTYPIDGDGAYAFELTPTDDYQLDTFRFWSMYVDAVENYCVYKVDDVSIKDPAAAVHIGVCEPDVVDGFERPFVLINRHGTDRQAAVGPENGSLEWYLEREIPAALRAGSLRGEAEMEFMNFVEAVLEEVRALSRTPGHLLIRSLAITEEPWQLTRDGEPADLMAACGRVDWGLSD